MTVIRFLSAAAALVGYFLASLLTTKGISGLFEGGGTALSNVAFVMGGTFAVVGITQAAPRLVRGRRGPVWLSCLAILLQPVAAIILYVVVMLSFAIYCTFGNCG